MLDSKSGPSKTRRTKGEVTTKTKAIEKPKKPKRTEKEKKKLAAENAKARRDKEKKELEALKTVLEEIPIRLCVVG